MSDFLGVFRTQFESALRDAVEQMGEKSTLRDACEYALTNGGKRLRPLIVMMVADALGHGLDVLPASLGVEYFHTASLIADDLPCMDNDDERRSRPSLHKAFEESVALLASYSLISAGYEAIYRNGQVMKKHPSFAQQSDAATVLGLETVTRCAGILGATNGQFLDLYPPDRTIETILKIIYQKTVTLFQISFCLGWLFGGGDLNRLEKVKECATHMGYAFQIADDLQDDLQDTEQESEINIASVFGYEQAVALFDEKMRFFEADLKELGLWTGPFRQAVDLLWKLKPPAAVAAGG
ncbi:MAG: polyprenyl synthetase family protein [Verrucomicrobia bacterium]|nr:polyprenyl synthetase family protein [Verrucomicrobiota bacterium]